MQACPSLTSHRRDSASGVQRTPFSLEPPIPVRLYSAVLQLTNQRPEPCTLAEPCELTYELDGARHTAVVDESPSLIGRSPDCAITVPDESVSRVHAELRFDNGQWTVRDKNSRNGIYLGVQKVAEARLRHGDSVTLGRIVLHFHSRSASRVQVQFDDTEKVPVVSQTIDVEKYREAMFSDSELIDGGAVASAAAAPSVPVGEDRSAQWALPLFSRAAEALLAATEVEAMLETVLGLVFDSLPAERGCAFLFDEDSGERTLEVMRTKSGPADEDFVISNTIVQQALEQRNAVLVMDSASDEALSNQDSIVMNMIRSAMCAPLYHDDRVVGLIYADTQRLHRQFTRQHLAALTTLGLLSAAAVRQAQLREQVRQELSIRERLERYSAPAVVTRIIEGEFNKTMLAEELEASVLFLDVANFTGLAERLSPIDTTRVLNSVFERLTDCVFEVEGTLDKFMGDGLMAIFGAPLRQPDHALRAVRAAMAMQREMTAFNAEAPEFPVGVRIGVASGPMLAGDIGSPRRKDFTVIGDTVNIASRLESSVAKVGHVVISPATYEAVKDEFTCEACGPVSVKGKSLVLHPYRVLGPVSA